VPIVPLYGHRVLRRRLFDAAERDALPASLLLHGPRGVGKQRLALWLGQALLCTGSPRPCGACQHCRYALELCHPDLHWFFPRPRLKDADASAADVRDDYADAAQERVKAAGLYAAPGGTEAIYVATVRAIVQLAAVSPAMARRKVFVVGDAERMVPQEGAEAAANAFLKLLEEPLPDTTIVVTSSEPGALLPTIRSRVVSVRVPRLPDEDVAEFVDDPVVSAALDRERFAKGRAERVRLAGGAPGALLGDADRGAATDAARQMLDAATRAGEAPRLRLALAQKPAGARGGFTDTLHALTLLLNDRARDAVRRRDERAARAACRAVESVERAKGMAAGNVNPQLVSAALLRELAAELR
jgi:DNA polymerase III subunit delta'